MILTLEQQQELQKITRGQLKFNEPMADHTTIKIGGPADVWFEPLDEEDLMVVVRWTAQRDVHRMTFGNGSNTLVRDKGIRGLIISLKKFDWIKEESIDGIDIIKVGAGTMLPTLLNWSIEKSLSGFESLVGIPGTVGGAVSMNAGTKEHAIGDSILSVKMLDKGKVALFDKEKLEFGYRKTKVPKGAIILEINFELKPADKTEIELKVSKLRQHKKETQPLLWPSLGSVFKNPTNGPKAWRLIDDYGLKGVRVGGARVSTEHANWIINEGNATAKDVEVLMRMIKDRVKEESGILLEPEILIVGE